MKNTLFVILIFSLTYCDNKQSNNIIANQKSDSSQIEPSLEKTNRIFNNPFRDINNFEIKTNDRFIDSLHNQFLNSTTAETTLIKDICIGDGCESYQTIVDKNKHTVLYFFKGDGGEYGFSNTQYYLESDSLRYVRDFDVNIESEPTDTTNTIWRVEQVIYRFQPGEVTCLKKTTLTEELDGFDFTLKDITDKLVKVGFKDSYSKSLTELDEHLKRKDSEYRD